MFVFGGLQWVVWVLCSDAPFEYYFDLAKVALRVLGNHKPIWSGLRGMGALGWGLGFGCGAQRRLDDPFSNSTHKLAWTRILVALGGGVDLVTVLQNCREAQPKCTFNVEQVPLANPLSLSNIAAHSALNQKYK